MSNRILIAVYGTLREGFHNHVLFGNQSEFVKDQFLPGFTLYGNTGVPHVVKDTSNDKGVYVELHSVPEALLPRLDALEGHTSDTDYSRNTYTRLQVETEEGPAYIYARMDKDGKFAYGNKEPNTTGIFGGVTRQQKLAG